MSFVSVKEFGAIGNGVADDTAAIHAAIKHAIKTQKTTVIFPSGNYKVTPPVGQAKGSNEG